MADSGVAAGAGSGGSIKPLPQYATFRGRGKYEKQPGVMRAIFLLAFFYQYCEHTVSIHGVKPVLRQPSF